MPTEQVVLLPLMASRILTAASSVWPLFNTGAVQLQEQHLEGMFPGGGA